ncbi:hypothetical protein M8818_006152 [Zalaria obscura]|uniref:Uncharacterized protein n=1 Tax=Zalaria obscura TaxID=2024903 RepID=A0ACC3S724_9PEZI
MQRRLAVAHDTQLCYRPYRSEHRLDLARRQPAACGSGQPLRVRERTDSSRLARFVLVDPGTADETRLVNFRSHSCPDLPIFTTSPGSSEPWVSPQAARYGFNSPRSVSTPVQQTPLCRIDGVRYKYVGAWGIGMPSSVSQASFPTYVMPGSSL